MEENAGSSESKSSTKKPRRSTTAKKTAKTDDTSHLDALADALSDAADKDEYGAGAQEYMDVEELAPSEPLARAVYKTCYALSYGVVFPTALVAGFVPKDNALVMGLADGAAAARDAIDSMRAQKAAERAARTDGAHADGTAAAGA